MNNAARARPSCLSRSFFISCLLVSLSRSDVPIRDPIIKTRRVRQHLISVFSVQCSVFSTVRRRDVKRGLFRLKVREGPDSSGAAE
jgi:hypothetical protein